MKLWIDDYRDAPDETWTVVRKVQPAISLLAKYHAIEISIDHDIENRPDDETFKPVAYFIGEKYAILNKISERLGVPTDPVEERGYPIIRVHSDNPVGAKELLGIFSDYGMPAEWHPYTTDAEFKTKYGL